MKLKKFKTVLGGGAALMAALLTISTSSYAVAKSDLARGWVDGFFGVDREIWGTREVTGVQDFKKAHSSLTEFADAMVEHGKKEGEEGFALLKNKNSALPLASGAKVALFGWNCYNLPSGHTGVVASNVTTTSGKNAMVAYAQSITLDAALKAEGLAVNETIVKGDFTGGMAKASGFSTKEFTIPEKFEEKDTWNIPSDSVGIVAVGRGGGEGANYQVDSASNAADPLALSDKELEMIDYAKAHCAKVVVLVVTANAMELGPIAEGGAHEVDAIGFCAIPNCYSYGGIAKVLAGKANASGGLTDTFVYDNSFNPASINMGEQKYSDSDSIGFATVDEDPFKRDNRGNPLSADNLNAPWYIVEAEGIYVGYKYYETRYFDSIVNPTGTKATNTIGSTKVGEAWNYGNEVLYPFGHGLSYVPYTQEVTKVEVGLGEGGEIKATVKVTNTGTQKAKFNTQLYVSKPYTEYDKENKVEKSAIDFLNSAKVEVDAGQSKDVVITLPSHYLASYDENGAKTYILDPGEYFFTAANGAHEAVNNVLTKMGKTGDGKTNGTGKAVVWNEVHALDRTSFGESHGRIVTNQAPDADINYYLPGKVTYMTRADWTTYPKNYTNYANDTGIEPEPAFSIADSAKKAEWLQMLRNLQYVPVAFDSTKAADPLQNLEGVLPDNVGEGKEFATMWDWITSYKLRNPAAFKDVNSEIWNTYAAAMNVNEAVGAILHGGNTTDTLSTGNPTSAQSESVAGYSQKLTIVADAEDDSKSQKMTLAIASNSLLAASFSPELAAEWGDLEGECGLWLMDEQNKGPITVWGAGLNLRRHAYNGRNSEYMSEDPMLTNRIGEAQLKHACALGAIVGPKHMGFNDQELHRQGIAEYMTEQKMRETDIRCYEGALREEEGNGNGVMMSFSRIGSQNVTNRVGLIRGIMREEWGFDGIISTDMGQKNYHEPFALINATVNQYAGFGAGDSYIGQNGTDFSDEAADKTWSYVTIAALKTDNYICEMARETNKYQQFTLANSANYNIRRAEEGETGQKYELDVYLGEIERADWENIFIGATIGTAILTGLLGLAWVAASVLPGKEF